MTEDNDRFMERWGIVRYRRWLGYGVNHGWMLRPMWLQDVVVTAWNWLSCHTFGHEWLPDIRWSEPTGGGEIHPTEDFCPNCDARRSRP
jgi:hypothetical protein